MNLRVPFIHSFNSCIGRNCTSSNFNNFSYSFDFSTYYIFIYIFTGGNQFFVFVPFRRLDHLFLLRLKFYKKKINKRNQFPIYSQNAKMSIGDEIKNKDAQKMFLRIISLERFFLFLYLLLYYECTVHEHVRVHWKAKKSVLMCLCICVCVCRY